MNVFACSNPNCGAMHAADPKGPCPTCVLLGAGNWSCVPWPVTPERVEKLCADQAAYHQTLYRIYKLAPGERGLTVGDVEHLACAAYHGEEITRGKLAELLGVNLEEAQSRYMTWTQDRG